MKQQIRQTYKEKRFVMSKEEVCEKSKKATELFLESEIYSKSKQLMLYMPLGNETDTSFIRHTAFRDGKRIVLPVTDQVTGEITPVFVTSDTKYIKGAFSVSEPVDGQIAELESIDVVLVPGIAFDARGGRIGFGKGCYDKLLADFTGVKVGICYDFQICDFVPTNEQDIKMDYLITEKRLICCL